MASHENESSETWVLHQIRDRAKLQSLSSQKRQLRLQQLQKTFEKSTLADPERLTELRNVVSRVQSKIYDFQAPLPSPEKYLTLQVKAEYANLEMQEDSELMEDLYKILPLTVDTLFDETCKAINCQFDTLTDL